MSITPPPAALPTLLAAGQFDSTAKFPHISKTPLRIVSEYELEYYFEEGGISFLNGNTYPMKKGNILIARPGDKRNSTLPFRCFFMHFTNISGDTQKILDGLPSFMNTENYQDTEDFFIRISTCFLSIDAVNHLEAIGYFFLFLKYLSQLKTSLYSNASFDSTSDLLKQAQKYIDLCYMQDLTVDILAQKCNISTSYLYKLFSKELRISPHAAILERKITAARSAIMNTDLPLSDIADYCGFSSQAYFSDCFKRLNNGLTPSAFRQQTRYQP